MLIMEHCQSLSYMAKNNNNRSQNNSCKIFFFAIFYWKIIRMLGDAIGDVIFWSVTLLHCIWIREKYSKLWHLGEIYFFRFLFVKFFIFFGKNGSLTFHTLNKKKKKSHNKLSDEMCKNLCDTVVFQGYESLG